MTRCHAARMRPSAALLAVAAAWLVMPSAAHARTATRTVAVHMDAQTKSVVTPPPLPDVEDRGTISGTPFGRGTIDLFAHFDGTHVTVRFTLTTQRGTVRGTADVTLTVNAPDIALAGTAKITGGTKRFRGIRGTGLRVLDTNHLDGQAGHIVMTGRVRLPR